MLRRFTLLCLCLAACSDSQSNGRADMAVPSDGFVALPDLAGGDGAAQPDLAKAQLGCIENKA